MARRRPSLGTGTWPQALDMVVSTVFYFSHSLVFKPTVFLPLYRQAIQFLCSFSITLNTTASRVSLPGFAYH